MTNKKRLMLIFAAMTGFSIASASENTLEVSSPVETVSVVVDEKDSNLESAEAKAVDVVAINNLQANFKRYTGIALGTVVTLGCFYVMYKYLTNEPARGAFPDICDALARPSAEPYIGDDSGGYPTKKVRMQIDIQKLLKKVVG